MGVCCLGFKKVIIVNNVNIVVDDLIGSIGLEFKVDFGVFVVYVGFGGFMFMMIISYFFYL